MDSNLPVRLPGSDDSLLEEGTFANTRMGRLLRKIAADQIERYKTSRIFPFPFLADEDILKRLQGGVLERLAEVPLDLAIQFKSETGFQDLSSITFDRFDEFLAKAGHKKDPESAELSWGKVGIDGRGEVVGGEVLVIFTTEKRLQSVDAEPGEIFRANIQMVVSGSDAIWVERTFYSLVDYVEATRLPGIYRPLFFFRNKWFVNVLSAVLSWIGFLIGTDLASRLLQTSARLSQADALKELLAQTDVNAKVNLLARQLLAPDASPWWQPILLLGTGAVSFAVLYLTGLTLLPKLTPNSSIAIGLSSRRAQAYLTAFKFVVFGLLLTGLLLPLIGELIKRFL